MPREIAQNVSEYLPSWPPSPRHQHPLMKAARIHDYGGPEQLCLEDIPVPTAHGAQVLVRTLAASVNPVDCKLASGARRPFLNNKAVGLPWVPGGDFSGIVEFAPEAVRGINKGDEVYGNCPQGGAYAQFTVAEAEHLALKPKCIDHTDAASVPVAGQTAWQALFDLGHLESGQTVLIHGGAGGVGSFAIQLARWKRAKVLATGSSVHSDYLRQLGAHETIDYTLKAFDETLKGLDLVIDLIGGKTQERSFKMIRAGGRLISSVSRPSQEMAGKHKVNAAMVVLKPSRDVLNQLTGLLESGAIKTHVSSVFALPQAQEAWNGILSRHTTGKIVLRI